MNILSIALKEVKHTFRDVRALVFMLAFPVLLMLVLGTALTNAFSGQLKMESVKVLYENHASDNLSKAFAAYTHAGRQSGLIFQEAKSQQSGKKSVKEGEAAGFVELTSDELKLYMNDRKQFEGSIVKGALDSFAGQYHLQSVLESENLKAEMNHHAPSAVKEVSLLPKKSPGSMDYYAVSMSTMIALYGAMGATSLMRGERVRRTSQRMLTAPVSRGEIFLGKVLGSIGVNVLCILIVVIFSKYVFKAEWGSHPLIVFAILLTEIILAVSFGLCISYMARTGSTARTAVMVVIQAASFIGGAYYQITDPGWISRLSPLTWANEALIKVIYTNDTASSLPAIYFNISLSVILFAAAVLSIKRREEI